MFRGIVGLFLLVAGCGKVGDPLPPFVRIPAAVRDLAVHQSGYSLVLTWTNPARNIDGSAATDLTQIRIRSNDSFVKIGRASCRERVYRPMVDEVGTVR